jgi:antitoxin MazE
MKTKIQKWGNSLAVRIPRSIAQDAHLGVASEVEVSSHRGEVRISSVRRSWDLDSLLSKVTKRRLHGEVSSGPPVGREVW